MIKFSELQQGDIVMAEFEGQKLRGVVKELDREDKEIGVETDVQEYFYPLDQLSPIPVDDKELKLLGFESEGTSDGGVKYKKGPFRIVIAHPDDFSHIEMWYREDRRHFHETLFVHQLQNHYYQMTKVELVP